MVSAIYLATVLDLTRRFTLAQFLERDDFARRYKANRPIAITEFLYPLLQAYDSVAIRSTWSLAARTRSSIC